MSTAFPSRHTHRPEEVPQTAPQRPGVIARLHGLFPTNTHEVDGDAGKTYGQRTQRSKPAPKYLKIRIITWNMHDSVPKGDLQDLLGVVSDDPTMQAEPGSLPAFPLDASHPYHLIIVAGQECPSLSGIPMGIGAGFKLKDKEREKDKENLGERPQLNGRHSEQGKDEDEERARRRSRHRSLIRHRSSHRRSHEDLVSASTSNEMTQDKYANSHHQLSGWTYMLENWFCNEGPSFLGGSASRSQTPEVGLDMGYLDENGGQFSPKAKSTGDLNALLHTRQKGPYELLVKERMMGLYLAVFTHRNIKPLVEKTSKSAVTAGLIGGRVGNKGGLGISLKVAGTSLLFINAHLAAHEGKIHHRIANFVKIKNELNVDDFLAADDPRAMREDLTDRFDFAFVCGDLNFRLDITRLHADWLISRREYEQALAFDQLHKIMQTNSAFVGFEEAPINFPPTFKYDVLRYKRSKKLSRRISKHLSDYGLGHEKQPADSEGKGQERIQDDSDDEPEADGEEVSLASTAYTSNTRYTTDGDDPDTDGEEYFSNPPSRPNVNPSSIVNDAKILSSVAAHKAKAKWMSLIAKPNSPFQKLQKVKQVLSSSRPQTPLSPSFRPQSPLLPSSQGPPFVAVTLPPTPDEKNLRASQAKLNDNYLKPNRSAGSSEHAPSPTPSGKPASTRTSQSNEKSDEEEEKAVYDTSHKQRVPSWCDRILWKSNLEPDSDSDAEDGMIPVPHRSRMGTFFHALRPASTRSRKNSLISTDAHMHSPGPFQHPISSSPSLVAGNSSTDNLDSLDPPHSSPPHITHSPHIALRHSRSTDILHAYDRPNPYRTRTQLPTFDELHPRSRRASSNSFGLSTSSQPSRDPPTRLQLQLTDSHISPPVPPKDYLPSPTPITSLWKSILPFLRDGPSQNTSSELPPTPDTPPTPSPRKGDVVCLGYDTLDDKQMKRLEGRSDHRPVIGSYALYV